MSEKTLTYFGMIYLEYRSGDLRTSESAHFQTKKVRMTGDLCLEI